MAKRGKYIEQLDTKGLAYDYYFDNPLLCVVCGEKINEDISFYWGIDLEDNSISAQHKNCLDVQKEGKVPCVDCGLLFPLVIAERYLHYGKVICGPCWDRSLLNETV